VGDRAARRTDRPPLGAGPPRSLAFYLHETKVRGLHQEWGYGSVVAYATCELGLKRRSARDYVAVGEALADLPLSDAAFCDGRLNWSKLRLVARIASAETEAERVEKAEALSFEEFEREIAGLQKGDRPRKDKLGLPAVRFTVTVRIDAVTFAEWERLKEKLALESGEPATDSNLFQRFTRIMLTDPEGAESRAADTPRAEIVIGRCSKGCCTEVKTEGGPIPLDDLSAEMICSPATR
jgi:hypothetical protein